MAHLELVIRYIPGVLAVVLFTPNLVLAFLGTGLQTFVLVAALAALAASLWV